MGKKNELAVTPQSENFSDWYNEIVFKADLADRGPSKGSMVIKPYGYAIWELIQSELDQRFKDTGHVNAYFPLLIPQDYLTREAEHVEGFAPEVAVVTRAGGKELEEPLVIRPTSETVIGEMYAKWITSHRDLPVLINQWANVVRWEMRPRIFLRTTEFLWQEGHTAHATEHEAREETERMLGVYNDFAHNVAAIATVPGEKVDSERFPGAENTYTIEGMMRDGKALQAGTSHYLGQNFAKAFDITFQSKENTVEHVYTTSWGVSTRMIGGIIMAHGDDQGLVLPPNVAPHQVVIVTIGRGDDRAAVDEAAHKLAAECRELGVRVHVDDRDASPGFRYNDWEMKGVPLRIEIGPRDLADSKVVLSHRWVAEGTDQKSTHDLGAIAKQLPDMLAAYQQALLDRQTSFRDDNTKRVESWDEFEAQVATGFATAVHTGDPEQEKLVKEKCKATPRCILTEEGKVTGFAPGSDTPAEGDLVVWGRAY